MKELFTSFGTPYVNLTIFKDHISKKTFCTTISLTAVSAYEYKNNDIGKYILLETQMVDVDMLELLFKNIDDLSVDISLEHEISFIEDGRQLDGVIKVFVKDAKIEKMEYSNDSENIAVFSMIIDIKNAKVDIGEIGIDFKHYKEEE